MEKAISRLPSAISKTRSKHSKPLLLGHRGTRIHAPENTLAAFDLCLAHGCDGFELDVRRTQDRQIVVVHDADVSGREVASSTFAELQSVSTHPLPLLSEVLPRYAATAFINIEMKVEGMEADIASLLLQYPPTKGVVISSFLSPAIREFQAIAPDVPCGFICRDPELLRQWKTLPVSHLVLIGTLVSEELVNEIHQQRKQLWIWTLNTSDECRCAFSLGVDGIISDDSFLLGSLYRDH